MNKLSPENNGTECTVIIIGRASETVNTLQIRMYKTPSSV